MGLVSDEFSISRMQRHVQRKLRKTPKYGPVIIDRPVKSIGRFYVKLPFNYKKQAVAFSRIAGSLPRPLIEKEYRRFESVAKYVNFTG